MSIWILRISCNTTRQIVLRTKFRINVKYIHVYIHTYICKIYICLEHIQKTPGTVPEQTEFEVDQLMFVKPERQKLEEKLSLMEREQQIK